MDGHALALALAVIGLVIALPALGCAKSEPQFSVKASHWGSNRRVPPGGRVD